MENDHHIFAEPPRELAAALGWRLNPSPEEIEEQAAMDLFSRAAAINNPWLAKPGVGGVIEYGDDDAREEREYAAAIEPIAKLFEPKPPTATAPNLNLVPLPIEQDDDEKQYFRSLASVEKLFHPDAFTTASSAETANRFQFTKRAPTPAPKEKPTLTYTKVVIDEDTWNEGRDESGELISMMLVTDDE